MTTSRAQRPSPDARRDDATITGLEHENAQLQHAVGAHGFLVDLLVVFGAQPGPAIEALAQDIGVPGMADGLAEDMDHDGEQVRVGIRLRPPRHVAGGVEGKLVDRRVRVFPRAPVEPDDLIAGLVLGRPQIAAVGVLPPGQRFRGRTVEDLTEVPGLDGGHVFDQAEEVGPGRCQRSAGVVFGQAVEFPEQRLAVPPQSSVQVVFREFIDHAVRACHGLLVVSRSRTWPATTGRAEAWPWPPP
jgi:hypothetical protein